MSTHYRHTQIGWAILVSSIAATALVLGLTPLARIPTPVVIALAIVLAVLLAFSTLTVEVDAAEIRLAFSGGLLRKRIALADVTALRAVRNRWLNGWGIKLIPGGWMWNVSGLDAVELLLRDGRVFRIGSDEPDALLAAIRRVAPRPDSPPGGDAALRAARDRSGRRQLAASVTAIAVIVALVAAAWYLQTRPPAVGVTPRAITIDSLFYGDSYPLDGVVGVSLEPELPRVLSRTHGFAGGASLRGRFQVEGMGEGELFLERGSPPYLVVRLRQGFVIVGFAQPERTRALFAELQRHLP